MTGTHEHFDVGIMYNKQGKMIDVTFEPPLNAEATNLFQRTKIKPELGDQLDGNHFQNFQVKQHNVPPPWEGRITVVENYVKLVIEKVYPESTYDIRTLVRS